MMFGDAGNYPSLGQNHYPFHTVLWEVGAPPPLLFQGNPEPIIQAAWPRLI